MLLILRGSSEVARTAIVSLICKKHVNWRNFSIDELKSLTEQTGLDLGGDDTVTAVIAAECAVSLAEDGHHVVMSVPEGEMHSLIKDELGDECQIVYFGDIDDSEDDEHAVDTQGRSTQQLYEAIVPLIKKMEEVGGK